MPRSTESRFAARRRSKLEAAARRSVLGFIIGDRASRFPSICAWATKTGVGLRHDDDRCVGSPGLQKYRELLEIDRLITGSLDREVILPVVVELALTSRRRGRGGAPARRRGRSERCGRAQFSAESTARARLKVGPETMAKIRDFFSGRRPPPSWLCRCCCAKKQWPCWRGICPADDHDGPRMKIYLACLPIRPRCG